MFRLGRYGNMKALVSDLLQINWDELQIVMPKLLHFADICSEQFQISRQRPG